MSAPPSYRVKFGLHIRSGNLGTSGVWLEHFVDMPCPPFPGLGVYDGDWEAEVVEVYWDVATQMFTVCVESDTTLEDEVATVKDGKKMEEIVQEWLELGWERGG